MGPPTLLPAASRMIANSLSRDSPPATPTRRPDTSKISVTVSNKLAAKSAGREEEQGRGRRGWAGRKSTGEEEEFGRGGRALSTEGALARPPRATFCPKLRLSQNPWGFRRWFFPP